MPDPRFLNVSGVMADLLATARADALALRAGAPLVAPAGPANHGALVLPIGCPNCEGAFTMRASSPARWNRVAAVLDCARCGAELVVHVTLSATGPRQRPGTTYRHPEHAGPAEQHEQNHAAAGAPLISSILAATGGR